MEETVMNFAAAAHKLPSNTPGELEKIDKDGDVILMPQTEATDATASLLVSSKVLSLASPVFAALLSPDFLEGNQVRRGHCPVIKLQDDDPAAMTAICNILHFRYDCVPSHIGPEQLAEIGILSDKYDCSKALQPWSAKWLSTHQTPPSELGHMLLAAYKLNDADHFASISAQVIRTLEPKRETWDISPQLESLPDRVKGDLVSNLKLP